MTDWLDNHGFWENHDLVESLDRQQVMKMNHCVVAAPVSSRRRVDPEEGN